MHKRSSKMHCNGVLTFWQRTCNKCFGWSSILLHYLHSSSFTETIFLSEVIFALNEEMVMFQLNFFQESFHVRQKLPGEREAGDTIKPGN